MGLVKPRSKMTGSPRTGGVKFEYRARTPEQVRANAQRQIGGRDSYFDSSTVFFTARESDNTVRILPPPPEADWGHYGISIVAHYDIGPDASAFLCRDKMQGEPCPICEERVVASAKGEDDYADKLKPGFRTAIYVIDRAQEGKGPMLWNLPGGLDKDITKLMIDPGTGEVLEVDRPDAGYDLSFTRKGTGLTTKYSGVQFARKPSPLSDDDAVAQAWLDHIVAKPLDTLLVYHDYDYIKNALEGQAPAETAAAETAVPAKPGRNVAPAAAAPAARPRIQPRGKSATPAMAPAAAAATATDLPTYDELMQMDEDTLLQVGEENALEFPADGSFESMEDLQAWVCEQLGIEKPAPAAPAPAAAAAGKGSWRDRLAKQTGARK
jgi:hypothetical protein